MIRLKQVSAAAMLTCGLSAGCGRTDVDPVPAVTRISDPLFAGRLLAEAAELAGILRPKLLLYAVFVIVAVYAMRRGMLLGTRVVWRLGWDTQRRLARLRSLLEITLLVVAILLLLRPFFLVGPVLAAIVLGVVLFLIALALPSWVQDLVAGVALAARTRFREGDQVRFGTIAGSVRHVGIWRTSIRAGDGGTISIPNREVLAHSIQVGREQRAAPVEVVLPDAAAATPDARDALLAEAYLSAFRRAGSRPTLQHQEGAWVVSMQTWCTRDLERARRALERQLLGGEGNAR